MQFQHQQTISFSPNFNLEVTNSQVYIKKQQILKWKALEQSNCNNEVANLFFYLVTGVIL